MYDDKKDTPFTPDDDDTFNEAEIERGRKILRSILPLAQTEIETLFPAQEHRDKASKTEEVIRNKITTLDMDSIISAYLDDSPYIENLDDIEKLKKLLKDIMRWIHPDKFNKKSEEILKTHYKDRQQNIQVILNHINKGTFSLFIQAIKDSGSEVDSLIRKIKQRAKECSISQRRELFAPTADTTHAQAEIIRLLQENKSLIVNAGQFIELVRIFHDIPSGVTPLFAEIDQPESLAGWDAASFEELIDANKFPKMKAIVIEKFQSMLPGFDWTAEQFTSFMGIFSGVPDAGYEGHLQLRIIEILKDRLNQIITSEDQWAALKDSLLPEAEAAISGWKDGLQISPELDSSKHTASDEESKPVVVPAARMPNSPVAQPVKISQPNWPFLLNCLAKIGSVVLLLAGLATILIAVGAVPGSGYAALALAGAKFLHMPVAAMGALGGGATTIGSVATAASFGLFSATKKGDKPPTPETPAPASKK